ncbi:transposase [Chryseobacterium soli]|uniref:Transposase n=1 Tax=Chryseobacterium soli TaxID=445961 RepID=A0A086ABH2_9FLAO|nr:hypothetical protein [Chryseobacterium soli]KFF14036.1 transposase [Chryseobacterium soli]MDV7696935.1 transposase [Chryseobacterium soli]
MNLKKIHIGEFIEHRMKELQIPYERAEKFLKCSEEEIKMIYKQSSIDTYLLLRWSKLLEYDFFRLFSGHLILYAPSRNVSPVLSDENKLPVFRKHIYTEEVKSFILEKITTGQMTPQEVILTYKIPKTTLYKWIKKV